MAATAGPELIGSLLGMKPPVQLPWQMGAGIRPPAKANLQVQTNLDTKVPFWTPPTLTLEAGSAYIYPEGQGESRFSSSSSWCLHMAPYAPNSWTAEATA